MRGSLSLVPPVAERGDSVDQEFSYEWLVEAQTDTEAIATFLRQVGNSFVTDLKESARARGILVEYVEARATGIKLDLTEGFGIRIERVVTVNYRLSLEIDHSYEMKASLLFGEVSNDIAVKLDKGSYISAKVSLSGLSESDIIPVSRV